MSVLQQEIPRGSHFTENGLPQRSREATTPASAEASPSDLPSVPERSVVLSVDGRIPTDEESRLTEFAKSAHSGSLSMLTEFLGRLMTLDAAMIGGAIAATKTAVLPEWSGRAAIIFLFASLIVSLGGLLPWPSKCDLSCYDEIAALERKTTFAKQWCVFVGAGFFLAAVIVSIAGFLA